ncbi:unnamed protein product [Rotaria socialis]|uniref:B box-type domain-containing protein n=3 Tax=Rotaria socialis TaxID=392032 RepID=A0A821TFI7_9BILA|nr:unnamed protein product [Rotaria socialis]CAF3465440.1 unnamed protein product [Rotaria socialis]CAF3598937.1 unnamed protein product [Rotaria socialis]CAF3794241.1 unnamed protein product [Rotaria socialis]CAF4500892.1 unnamed protein product [Rotaria socialis]
MSSLKRESQTCSACGITAGIFVCRGCLKSFCLHHTNEHRNSIEQQMETILFNHERLRQFVASEEVEEYFQQLHGHVSQWETQSINKIRDTANDIRQQLKFINQRYHDSTDDQLRQLKQQIRNAQNDGNFFENDLKMWQTEIQKLQSTISEQENLQISLANNSESFISRIKLTDKTDYDGTIAIDYFECNRKHVNSEDFTNLNLKGEYSSGNKLFRFKLDDLEQNTLVLMGIISASRAKNVDPYKNPTFYGWSTKNLVYLHGVPHSNIDNYQSDIDGNDIFQLILDCERQTIRLINERTHRKYELNIDISKCPFPWQPHVRILSSL